MTAKLHSLVTSKDGHASQPASMSQMEQCDEIPSRHIQGRTFLPSALPGHELCIGRARLSHVSFAVRFDGGDIELVLRETAYVFEAEIHMYFNTPGVRDSSRADDESPVSQRFIE